MTTTEIHHGSALANDLLQRISEAVGDNATVTTVSRLRHWVSDEDAARRRAKERAATFVEQLEQHGVRVEDRVGDADPLLAIADALWTSPAGEILIAARPEPSSRLVDKLVAQALRAPAFRAVDSLPRAAYRHDAGIDAGRRCL